MINYIEMNAKNLLLPAAVLLGAGCLLTQPASSQGFQRGHERFAEEEARIQIDADRSRQRGKDIHGDYDDQQDNISMKITLRNRDLSKTFENMEAIYMLIGRSAVDRKSCKVLDRDSFNFSLGKDRENSVFEWESKEVITTWDDTNLKHGERYDGWIIVLLNSEGKIAAVKASKENWESGVLEALELKAGDWFGYNFKPIAMQE